MNLEPRGMGMITQKFRGKVRYSCKIIIYLLKLGVQILRIITVSMATRFFDPLGVVSIITILFKIFFQKLCEDGVSWDDPLTGELLTGRNQLISALQGTRFFVVRRCYLTDTAGMPKSARIAGFCDASAKAYAVVAYLRLKTETSVCVRFLSAKTCVSPLGGMTIPCLELSSALLLSKLIPGV